MEYSTTSYDSLQVTEKGYGMRTNSVLIVKQCLYTHALAHPRTCTPAGGLVAVSDLLP
eukprot:m.240409 g.240409  ORF g.240409 m.240409 type:complete len:58 (-) comp50255_c0_seq1:175-348(-)